MKISHFVRQISSAAIISLVALTGIVHADDPLAQFNNMAGDQEFMQARNITKDANGSFTDPVQANANDEVEVAIYYHNTVVGSIAKNTTVKVVIPAETAKEHLLKGAISADGVASVSGTIIGKDENGRPDLTIQSNADTTVKFVPGSVRWYPERIATDGPAANLPNGQNGNTLISTGINLGDIAGCFEHSGFIKFNVKLEGIAIPQAALEIKKDVRKGGSQDPFIDQVSANPGNYLEYKITVRNVDGAITAHNIRVKDTLPGSVTYIGPTTVRYANGATNQLPDGITVDGGILVAADLKPSESLEVTFAVSTSAGIANAACLLNTAKVSADNSTNSPSDTANACFVVPVTPTPTPVPPVVTPPPPIVPPAVVKPTPKPPVLPKTGPESSLLLTLGFAGMGSISSQYYIAKKKLGKAARRANIL